MELKYALFCTKDCQQHDQQLATALIYIYIYILCVCVCECGELSENKHTHKPKFRQISEMPLVI